jgi:hypothetical protein
MSTIATPRADWRSDLQSRFPEGVSLADGTPILRDGPDLVVASGSPFRIGNAGPAVEAFLSGLATGRAWSEIDAEAGPGTADAVLKVLAERDLLVARIPVTRPNQFTNQMVWLAQVCGQSGRARAQARTQEAIRAHRAVIIGCGGVGSIVALHLGALGISELVLIDHDRVEITNFNRQFAYRRRDIGRPKAEALADVLAERYPETAVVAVEAFVDSHRSFDAAVPADWSGPGVTVFCGADRPIGAIAALIAEQARRRSCGVAFASAGTNDVGIGPVGVGSAGWINGFGDDMASLAEVAGQLIHDPIVSGSVAPVNTVAAAWMVQEWLNAIILGGHADAARRFSLDLRDGAMSEEARWE